MIRLPEDVLLKMSNELLDIYYSSEDLDEFKREALAAFPDDPTLSHGYWIGLIVGRIEGKTKIANELFELAEKFWGGHEIQRRPKP